MQLKELAEKIGATLIASSNAEAADITNAYGSNRISELLNEASDHTLLVTDLGTALMVRVAELMDAPGICLLNGVEPKPEVLEAARNHGKALLVSPADMKETCARLAACLGKSWQDRK